MKNKNNEKHILVGLLLIKLQITLARPSLLRSLSLAVLLYIKASNYHEYMYLSWNQRYL